MYRKILVALENGSADEALVDHVALLAQRLGSELLLLHVADGWAARHYDHLKLAESEEMRADRTYLEKVEKRLRDSEIVVSSILARGDPPKEIIKVSQSENCDLIAMGGHGHRLIGDLIHGSTIHEVRHATATPVLLVRARKS